MKYQELKAGIRNHLNSAAEDFFTVGYFLRQISENALFLEDGYKSIWEFAKGEYGLSNSSACRFMAINERFSIDDGQHMDQKYIGMGPSKLQEMLGFTDEELEAVNQETTVREIRAMKAAKLSFFKLKKTERPEGSTLTTVGCGDGKYSCFCCSRQCNIRQDERQCVISPCGNPQPCNRIHEEALKDMEAGMYKSECQFLHQELAEVRAGDGEPEPCCRHCKYKGTCYSSCDVAKKEYEKEVEENRKKAAKEAEAKKAEPTEQDIVALYNRFEIGTTQQISGADLKRKYSTQTACGGSVDYQGSARGVRINNKKEITWAKVAKAFKEIQERRAALEKRERDLEVFTGKSDPNELPEQAEPKQPEVEPEEKAPEIIDAVFREVSAEPKCQIKKQIDETGEEDLKCSGGVSEKCEDCEKADKEPEHQEVEIVEASKEDPTKYSRTDVAILLDKYAADLKAYQEMESQGKGKVPAKLVKRHTILVDALQLLKKTFDIDDEDREEELNG